MRDCCYLGFFLLPPYALSPSPSFCPQIGESSSHLSRDCFLSWCVGRDSKAAAQALCSLPKYRAEVLCSCAALTFTGMAARCETAKVRSNNATGLPSLTKNAVGQRQATALFA